MQPTLRHVPPSVVSFSTQAVFIPSWAARIALMYKSMPGYLQVLEGTDEAFAFSLLAPLLEQATEEGVGALFEEGNLEQGREALQTLLESPEVADLVNDEVLDLISNSPNALFHAQQVWEHLSGFGSFMLRDKNERVGRNPKTGIEVPITPRRVMTFRASQIVKDRIAKGE